LIGNTDIDDSLQKLDKLTEEARVAFEELPKVTHDVGPEKIQDVLGNDQDVSITGGSASAQAAGPTSSQTVRTNEADSSLHSTFEATVADSPQ
jgi:hypothetical protein